MDTCSHRLVHEIVLQYFCIDVSEGRTARVHVIYDVCMPIRWDIYVVYSPVKLNITENNLFHTPSDFINLSFIFRIEPKNYETNSMGKTSTSQHEFKPARCNVFLYAK